MSKSLKSTQSKAKRPSLWLVRNELSLPMKQVRFTAEAEQQGFEVIDIFEPNIIGLAVSETGFEALLKSEKNASPIWLPFPNAALTITGDWFLAPMATELLFHLELAGVPVINTTRARELANNKWWTHQQLVKAKVATPRTVYLSKELVSVGQLGQQLGYPLVLKAVYGSKGEAVWLCRSEAELAEQVSQLAPEREIILQEYIAASHGRDVRVIVVDGVVVGSMLRSASQGRFQANLGAEGAGQPFSLTPEQEQLAVAAAKALGLGFAGIDLLFNSQTELIVCEVNSNPGLGIEEVVGCNVAGSVMRWLWQRRLP